MRKKDCDGCAAADVAMRDALADIRRLRIELAAARSARELSVETVGKIIAFGKAATLENIELVHERIQEAVRNG
jgi:hypothetical protein